MLYRIARLCMIPAIALISSLGIASLVQAQPTLQWSKSLGGSNDDIGYSVSKTADHGYVVVGLVGSTDGDVHGHLVPGYGGGWIAKLNSDGDTLWTRLIGGDRAESVVQTADGGYVVSGNSHSTSIDIWVTKLNSNGETEWTKSFGGSGEDDGRSVIQAKDHGYVIVGATLSIDGDAIGNHGSIDALVIKLDENGNKVWSRTLGGSYIDEAWSVVETADSGFAIAGDTYSNDGDVPGNHDLTHQTSDYWVVKLNSSGGIVWSKSLGGSGYDQALSIVQATDGGYAVVGQSYSVDGDVHGNHGGADFWIAKLNQGGDTVWTRSLGGSGSEGATSIIQATDGNFVVAGYTYSPTSQTDSGYAANGDVLANHGMSDYWIVKLSPDGGTLWTKSLGGGSNELAFSIIQTNDSPDLGYVVAGSGSSGDGDMAGSGFHGIDDFWVVKLSGDKSPSPLLVSGDRASRPESYNLSQNYPNPFNPSTVIQYDIRRAVHVTLRIYDVLGRQVGTLVDEERKPGSYESEWDASQIPSGVYYYRLNAGAVSQTKKMVLMK